MLSEEEKRVAATIATYAIWRVEGDGAVLVAICLSAEYAELELAKRRAVFGDRLRFERSGPSNVLYDYEKRTIDAAIARALLSKFAAGERGAIDL